MSLFKKTSLFGLLLMMAATASAHDFEVDNIFYEINGNEATVTYDEENFGSYSGSVIIPETVTWEGVTYPVTAIGNDAFESSENLQSLTIGNNVRVIGSYAVANCYQLTSVTFGTSVQTIDESAFSGCGRLTAAVLPDAITTIGDGAFYYCQALETLHLGSGLTSIGYDAFYECRKLAELTIPEHVTYIAEGAFDFCPLSSISVADGNPEFDSREDCHAVIHTATNTLVLGGHMTIIPSTVTAIGERAFINRFGVTETLTIPGSVTTIGKEAFYNCDLTSVIFEDGLTAIGEGAFSSCNGLNSITFPNTLTSIEDGAFDNCCHLVSVTIPSSVTHIGANPFTSCDDLEILAVDSGNTSFDSRNGCNAIIETSSNTLLVGCSTTFIPDGVTAIGNVAFYSMSFQSITIPEGVTTIGDGSFGACRNLADISFPSTLTTIGEMALEGTQWLDNQPDGVVYAGPVAYTYKGTMPSGTSLELEEGTRGIASQAFYNQNRLVNITFPSSLVAIGDEAFYSCTGLTSITFPSSLVVIGEKAFNGCAGLTSVVIPDGTTTIERSAFSSCSNLTSVTFSASVTNIGYDAFLRCNLLRSVTCLATTPPVIGVEEYSNTAFEGVVTAWGTLYVPYASIHDYKNARHWKKFEHVRGLGDWDAGDLNGDGEINISDVTLLINYLLTGVAEDQAVNAADANGDGEINISDITYLINLLTGNP